MMLSALAAGFLALILTAPLSWPACLLHAAVCAPVAAYTELISHGGSDTVNVPAAAALCLWLLSLL